MGFGALDLVARFVEVRANARRDRRSIERLQLSKFRRLLARVVAGSPWYASLVRERGIDVGEARPEDFPVLTKQLLMRHFDDIVTRRDLNRDRVERFLAGSQEPADLMDGRYVVVHTSGTSGTLGFCAYTREEWLRGWTTLSRLGGVPLPGRGAFVGAVRGHFAGVSLCVSPGFLPRHLWFPRHWVRTSLFDINDPWEKTLAGLDKQRPDVLASYGSAMKELALAQREGKLHLRPRQLICGGDSLGTADREMVSESFGAPLYNLYAATETMAIGLAGPDGELVLCEDDLIVEVREDHLLVTNLLNGTTPLIRYRLDDTLVVAPDGGTPRRRCPGFRRASGVVGRSEEKLVLLTEAGTEDFIHPIVVAEFFVRGVDGFRAVRKSPTHLLVEARPAPGLDGSSRENLAREIREAWAAILSQKRMRTVTLEVRLVGSLASDPKSGKFKLVAYEG